MNTKHVSFEYLLKAKRVTWENAEVIDHLFRYVASEDRNGLIKTIYRDSYENVNEDNHHVLGTKQGCRHDVGEAIKERHVHLDYSKVINVSVLLSYVHIDEYISKCSSSAEFFKEQPSPSDNTSSATGRLMTVSSPPEPSREDNQNTICTICHKKFKSKSQLTVHLRTHTGEKPFGCPQCEKQFSQKGHLKKHLLLHSGTKRFSCNICRKTFTRSDDLKSHSLVHSGIREFSCDICFKLFARKSNLTSHRRTHTGDKPFECNECNAMFSTSSNLSTHMRTHTGETPYQCNICDRKFTQLGSLKDHLLIHGGEKPFACTYANCKKTFRRKGDLQRHIRVHKKKNSCPF